MSSLFIFEDHEPPAPARMVNYMKQAVQALVLFLVLLGCFASGAQSQGHGPDIFSCERQLNRPCDLCYCCLMGANNGTCYATDVECRLNCPPPKSVLP